MHGQRFFFSNNDLDPKIYQVTKIKDLDPQGVIKLSIKQAEYNPMRDNLDLHVCDYYNNTGDIKVTDPSESEYYYPSDSRTSAIKSLIVNDDREFIYSPLTTTLNVGVSSYYYVSFSDYGIDPEWRIKLVNDAEYSDDEIAYYEGLVKLYEYDSSTIYIKPGKAGSLKGKHFILSVADKNGEYYSSIELEVA